MPTYVLYCDKCNKEIEFFGKFEETPTICECGGTLIIKLFPVNSIYKCGGFYKTEGKQFLDKKGNIKK